MHIQRLFIYPIKSLLPVEVSSAEITSTGFRHDRQYILVKDPATRSEKKQSILDDDQDTSPSAPVLAEHLTIKTLSKLCLFQSSIDLGSLTLTVRHNISGEGLTVPLEPAAEFLSGPNRFEVEIFGTRALGLDLGNDAATFFSKHLSQPARLLYIGQNSNGLLGREIPAPSLVPRKQRAISWLHGEEIHDQKIQFADAAPLLLTTTASEHDARSTFAWI
ncbi:hypothetical protein LTR10_017497 [Elasticomyces elasticus]|uniref:Molybdenum cofactor sulfurase middle domain-containing protein n=1 Tax=Exophiala sideris TaxID=1016849 RepID=A0ABR0IZQ9_9EURO|nr:hypothetical protein LTR10_017497 [Elasticomyces elasticus]KAK5023497.1 hypothetical protein LTS07_009372 [Exophiala sideris]KAK5028127.1 hypothetical protein LTR13_009115 [Exophiala sideris]KAK5052785.1 hypothetical protein LTR69_009611 [Exophiala sideris]KAK5178396.1 hypothetical protein LTR44_009021 [Eurotiomycetes sp. CCFEE 6388]